MRLTDLVFMLCFGDYIDNFVLYLKFDNDIALVERKVKFGDFECMWNDLIILMLLVLLT